VALEILELSLKEKVLLLFRNDNNKRRGPEEDGNHL
jgi:hypothetical protein